MINRAAIIPMADARSLIGDPPAIQERNQHKLCFHELRHTYASALAQTGMDLLTISKLLERADTRITSRHHAHLYSSTLKAAVANLPRFGHPPETKVPAIR